MRATSQQAHLRQQLSALLTPAVRHELAAAVLLAVLSLVLAGLVLNIWDADLGVPFQYRDDGNLNQMVVKSVIDHGWYQQNFDLGAPYGMELYDFPVVAGDNLSIEIVKVLGLFSSDAATVMNLFYLAGFPLIALSAYLAMRLLGLSLRVAVACSLLYALLPYHFERGEIHLWLGAYYGVPLGAFLALALLQGMELFERRGHGHRLLSWASPRSLLVVGACAVVASAQVYFAVFTLIFVVSAALLAFLARRDRSALAGGAVVVAVIAGVTVLHHLPTLLYRADHGRNDAIERTAADTERYGLKLVRLVLPVHGHRLAPLEGVAEKYADAEATQLYEGASQALGMAATIGFLWLLWVALSGALGAGRGPPDRLARALAVLTVVALLVAMVGGVSSIIGHYLTTEIRSWARLVVFIAFFSLVGFGLLLERVRVLRGGTAGVALLAVVTGLALLDQTSVRYAPAYGQVAAEYSAEADLVERVEALLPPNAAVFQLPYVPFPEPQITDETPNIGPYDQSRGYLHSDTIRWSWGTMKGRHRDWQGRLAELPLALALPPMAAVGFDGIWVDRAAYEDQGVRVVSDLSATLGVSPLKSAGERFFFFDMRPYAGRLRGPDLAGLRRAALSPVYVEPAAGFGELEADGLVRSRVFQNRADLVVVNTGREPRRVRFDARLRASAGRARVAIAYPGGPAPTVEVPSSEEKRVGREFLLPPGRHVLRFSIMGGDEGPMRVIEPRVVDAVLASLAPGPTPYAPPQRQAPFGLR